MQDKFSLMPEGKDPLKDLRTTLKMQEAVTKKKQQKGSGDPYLDLQRDQFDFMKQQQKEQNIAAQESAMTQGIMGGLQSGVQTAFGSQSQEQALGGALTTGLQVGMTMGPVAGAVAGLGSLFLGSKSAKKAEAERKKAAAEEERRRKLQEMRSALAGYSTSKQAAMTNLMNVLR